MKEIWKDITGYEGLYSVSNKGKVKNIITNRILRPAPARRGKHKCGHAQICLRKEGASKYFNLGRLVATYFLPNPLNLPKVIHIDNDMDNNEVSNLKWATNIGTMQHAITSGLVCQRGENSGLSKYTDKDVLEIRDKFSKGVNKHDLAKEYGMSLSNIYRIINREIWTHI